MTEPATLYVVATPIGNLEDLTRRAERVLAEVDVIACEDTRRTLKLLSRLGLKKTLISYYEPKEEKVIPKIIDLLAHGKDVALVTDGGTPAISDPGYRLVKAALAAGAIVTPVPGPSALTAALSVCGLPSDRITFAGFTPPKSGARKTALAELADRRDTLVLYESPRRVQALLADAQEVLGDRQVVLFREMTKVFEERIDGTISEVLGRLESVESKGEFTVLISGADADAVADEAQLIDLIQDALAQASEKPSQIAARLARQTNWPRKTVYELIEQVKNNKP